MFPYSIFMLISFLSLVLSKYKKYFFHLLLLSQFVLFISIFSLSSVEAYADRAQYLYWFNNVDNQLEIHHDKVFIFLLKIISLYGTDMIWFFLSFSIIIIFIYYIVSKKYLKSIDKISIFFLLMIPNRFILEFSMNSMRAFFLTTVLLLLLYLIIYNKKYFLFIFIPALYWVHSSVFLMIITILFVSLFINKNISLFVFIFSIPFLLTTTGNNEITNFLNLYFSSYMNEYRYGAVNQFIGNNLDNQIVTFRAFIPMLISFVLPILYLLKYQDKMSTIDKKIFNFIMLGTGIVFYVYLTIPVIFRVMAFTIPLIYLLILKYIPNNSKIFIFYIFFAFIISCLAFFDNFKGSLF